MSSRPISGATTSDDRDAQHQGSQGLLRPGPSPPRDQFLPQRGLADHATGRQWRRQDHDAARDLQHGALDRRDRGRGQAAERPHHRRRGPARHRPRPAGSRHLHHHDGGGKPSARRHHAHRQEGNCLRYRAYVRPLPRAKEALHPAGRYAVGRRAADACGRARTDAAAALDAAGRAVIRPGAADRARPVQDPRQDQPRGQGHHPGGGAERAARARARRPGLCDRNRAHRDVGQCQRNCQQRRRSQILSGLLRAGTMELFTNQVLAGIATGAIYACMALAVVMIYQAIDHLNFAQGEMAMFSTFVCWQLMQWGVPYWGAFLITLVFSFAGGIAIDRLLFKPLAKAPILTNVAGFIALYAIINSVAGLIWDFTIKQFPTPFRSSPFLGSQLISTHQAGMIGVTLMLLLLLFFFFRFTRMGLAMRAAASLPESARLVGINTSWMIALGWGMAAAIGAIAGMLIAPVVFLQPNMMLGVLIYGFAAAVLGGVTRPLGAVVGGFLVRVFGNLVGTHIPGVGNGLKMPIALALIITVLVVKPAGLFGRPIVKRV